MALGVRAELCRGKAHKICQLYVRNRISGRHCSRNKHLPDRCDDEQRENTWALVHQQRTTVQFCCAPFAASAELTRLCFVLKIGASGTSAPDTSVPVSVHLYQVLVYHKEARTVDKVPRDRFSPARVSVSGKMIPPAPLLIQGKMRLISLNNDQKAERSTDAKASLLR